MSDYMFMLDSHLNGDQARTVNAVQQAATETGSGLFLAGGAMRDMLGGFPIRDLDFCVEGPALKVAKAVAATAGATILSQDEHRKTAELAFPGGITAQIGMARVEKFAKPGARPQVTPATIHEDLRGRDFTVNAVAIALNRASRGLLIDPANGLADVGHRELRSVHPYIFYDDPVRLIRLLRFKVRFGFTVEARTLRFFSGAAGIVRVLTGDRELVYSLTLPQPGDIVWTGSSAKHGLPGRSPAQPASTDIWPWLALLGSVGLLTDWMLFGRKQGGAAAAPHTLHRLPWRKAS